MAVDLLHALHENPGLSLHRVGGRLGLAPTPPEEARLTLSRHKAALLQALEDGERVEARALLSSPFRLAALLAHALGVEGEVVRTLYPEGLAPATRYLPPEGLTPYLAWAHRDLPPPRRLHLADIGGRWVVDLVAGWEVALEAVAAGTRYLLFYPEHGARGWLEAARAGLALHGVSVWRPGTAPRPLLLTAA
ncbi:hypothetical protein [Thermus scotoductus]|uniref:hypothetical protein n=1 Tax=Thermus scotoductus TaxID=37636 RepID=UPI00056DEAF9|nr:hypothetical protein [Thermus scotoductus]